MGGRLAASRGTHAPARGGMIVAAVATWAVLAIGIDLVLASFTFRHEFDTTAKTVLEQTWTFDRLLGRPDNSERMGGIPGVHCRPAVRLPRRRPARPAATAARAAADTGGGSGGAGPWL